MPANQFIKNSRQIRYVLFFLTLFMMIFTIRTYLNHFEIETSIQQTKDEIERVEKETAFMENFKVNYLDSDYGKYFMAHESSITTPDETVVRIRDKKLPTEEELQLQQIRQEEEVTEIVDPRESWQHFLQARFSKFLEEINLN
ncbi:hypothetical protein [Candidatus Absconditicoccus praedator]|uniref:hypothetical protein n=1 Tax=Candidatus Absconditicoccus praedator TaxID=2735562 RepID=UPI001E64B56C|nr:hypothetical protein [Candidatus Absconditicoccus praedator]UFX82570.1 hypothetical protein HLG78_00255 [Candidatus Absconditicoccus praedator]